MMTKQELGAWIRQLIEMDKLYKFYKSRQWLELKEDVMKEQHYECQECLKKGILTTSNKIDNKEEDVKNKLTVHHIQFVKNYPELALSKFYYYKGIQYRNLITVCFDCHNKLHKRFNYKETNKKQLNEERW